MAKIGHKILAKEARLLRSAQLALFVGFPAPSSTTFQSSSSHKSSGNDWMGSSSSIGM